MLILTFMLATLNLASGVPFKDLEEVKRAKVDGLIVQECQPHNQPLHGPLAKISYCLSIQPILYNLERLSCEPVQKYQNRSEAYLRDSLYLKFKLAEKRLPRRSNLARFIRNHICNMEANENLLPQPETLSWSTFLGFKCDIRQLALAYSQKVTDNLVKGFNKGNRLRS